MPVAAFTLDVKSRLDKLQLKFRSGLANLGF